MIIMVFVNDVVDVNSALMLIVSEKEKEKKKQKEQNTTGLQSVYLVL